MGAFTLLELTTGAKGDMGKIKDVYPIYVVDYFITLSGPDTL